MGYRAVGSNSHWVEPHGAIKEAKRKGVKLEQYDLKTGQWIPYTPLEFDDQMAEDDLKLDYLKKHKRKKVNN